MIGLALVYAFIAANLLAAIALGWLRDGESPFTAAFWLD